MLYDCLFSLNKRAKNCRDMKNRYWRTEYKWDYIERMDHYCIERLALVAL